MEIRRCALFCVSRGCCWYAEGAKVKLLIWELCAACALWGSKRRPEGSLDIRNTGCAETRHRGADGEDRGFAFGSAFNAMRAAGAVYPTTLERSAAAAEAVGDSDDDDYDDGNSDGNGKKAQGSGCGGNSDGPNTVKGGRSIEGSFAAKVELLLKERGGKKKDETAKETQKQQHWRRRGFDIRWEGDF